MNQKYGELRSRYLNSDPSSLSPAELQTYFQMKQQPRQTPQAFSLGVPPVTTPSAPARAVTSATPVSPSPVRSPRTAAAPRRTTGTWQFAWASLITWQTSTSPLNQRPLSNRLCQSHSRDRFPGGHNEDVLSSPCSLSCFCEFILDGRMDRGLR